MSGPASTTPESEAVFVVVAAEVVLLSDMKDTGLGSLMVCESEMGESDLEPESCGSDYFVDSPASQVVINRKGFGRNRKS